MQITWVQCLILMQIVGEMGIGGSVSENILRSPMDVGFVAKLLISARRPEENVERLLKIGVTDRNLV